MPKESRKSPNEAETLNFEKPLRLFFNYHRSHQSFDWPMDRANPAGAQLIFWMDNVKTKAPARLFKARQGPKWGMGVRHALFPMLALGASGAASFPTLFSTASGVSGLVAGPSSASPPLDFE
jgi:hypothetical protein